MSAKYIMAIDEGTTSTRTIIFNHAGQKVADAQKEFPQYFPQPGWVEHDATEIWNAVSSTIANVLIDAILNLIKSKPSGSPINVRLPLSGTSKPVYPFITPLFGSPGKLHR